MKKQPTVVKEQAPRWNDEIPLVARPKLRSARPPLLKREEPEQITTQQMTTRILRRVQESTPLERATVAFTGFLVAGMIFLTVQGQAGRPAPVAGASPPPVREVRDAPGVWTPLAEEVEEKDVPWTLQVPPGADVDPLDRPVFDSDGGVDILSLLPDTDPAIRDALESDDPDLTLGKEALPLLMAALDHPEPDTAQLVKLLEILARTPTPRILLALRQAATSSIDDVRQMALVVLQEARDEEVLSLATRALLEGGPESRFRARGILQEAGSDADPILLDALRTSAGDSEEIRLLILDLLTGRPVEGALHTLLDLLEDGTPGVRRAAARALGFWEEASPLQVTEAGIVLRVALEDPSPEVRSQAALALLSLGGEDAIPSLVELMRDEDKSVRKAARRSLAGLCGDDAGGSYYAWKRYLEENHD